MHGNTNAKVPRRVYRSPPQVITPCQIKPVNNLRHFFNGSVKCETTCTARQLSNNTV
jgi:hypothetical protein